MKRKPTGRIFDAKRRNVLAHTCIFCKEPGNLKAAAHEVKNRAGIPSRVVYLYHEKCLDDIVEKKPQVATDVILAIKQTEELKKQREDFMKKTGESAANWYKAHKKEKNEAKRVH